MLDALAQVYDDAGRLLGVTYTLFEGNPRFVTSVSCRFESLTAVFNAVSDDDTLAASIGPMTVRDEETVVDVSDDAPWAGCVGRGVCWAWRMTNQQGYTDGVRLEFSGTGGTSSVIVELVVTASSISVFVSEELAHGAGGSVA